MAACKLVIGDRTVLESSGGPPEAEYALFDSGNCELQATEPGTIREVGYRSRVSDARQRLADAGITKERADEVAALMKPALAQAYARGAAVRRVATLLGPVELFDGAQYDAKTKAYAGAWLDLAELARATKLPRAGALLQALYLAALLAEEADTATIFLHTLEHTRTRRPGERSYRRPNLDGFDALTKALRTLAATPQPVDPDRAAGPTRQELLDAVRARAATCAADAAREHLVALERALSIREPPPRGPLADPDLWPLEAQLSTGDTRGVGEKLDAIERARGRLPATMYLRARLALLTKSEEPRGIAERMSALSQSMSSFFEIELLAARAWLAAGDDKRGKAFARDLVENPNAPDELRVAALELLEGPVSTDKAPAPRSSQRGKDSRREDEPAPDTAIDPQPIVSVPPPPPEPAPPAAPSAPPPRPSAREPMAKTLSSIPPPMEAAPAPRKRAVTADYGAPRAMLPPEPAKVIDVQGEPVASAPEEPAPPRESAPPPYAPHFIRGASRPPYASEAPGAPGEPAPFIPPSPPVPRARGVAAEPAETLSLPPGLHGLAPPLDALPRTPFEARVAFTFLSRELGKEYRTKRKIELRTDIASVEIMQRFLHERFPNGLGSSPEDALELRRHGAFLSEILARTLGAYWVDVAPSEIGYFAMVVPPATRIWPFGRLYRFLAMGHRERDLVSYVLELDSRARR